MTEAGRADPSRRILSREELLRRYRPPREGELVFTNGVFDVLHRGHASSLYRASTLGDALVVGVNSDASVRRLKGPERPIQPQADRAYLVASVRGVDAVTVFEEDTPAGLIRELRPDVLVKGADYDAEEIAGADSVREAGGRVERLPVEPGNSTTAIVQAIRAAGDPTGASVEPERPGGGADLERGDPEPTGHRLLVATRNSHKLGEIRDLLAGLPIRIVSLPEADVPPRPQEEEIEVHDTFEGNAVAKARYFYERTGLFTVADDSGLCVDALDGGPGVRTKRFAPSEMAQRFGRDEANNRYLMERLADVPPEKRGARYVCAVAATDGNRYRTWTGRVEGRIARRPRGEGGFGYDPLFLLPERGRTYAELPPEVKAENSHRARAFSAFRGWLQGRVEGGEGGR